MTPDLTDAAVEAAAEALGITLDDDASPDAPTITREDIRSALLAALPHWQPPEGWRTMESALKDGTALLLSHWSGQRCDWIYDGTPNPHTGSWKHGGVGLIPTHWMPLPLPPAESEAKTP